MRIEKPPKDEPKNETKKGGGKIKKEFAESKFTCEFCADYSVGLIHYCQRKWT